MLPIDALGAWWTPPGLAVEYFRPVIATSFVLDHALYGLHAFGYHLTNLVVHVVTTLLVWGIARRVLRSPYGAAMAAVLFGLQPCHVQAVAWVSARTDLFAGVFYAAACLAFVRARPDGDEPEGRARSRVPAYLLGALFLLLALLSKEMAITLPAVLALDAWLAPSTPAGARNAPRALASRFAPTIVAGLVAAGYIAVRLALFAGFRPPPPPFAFSLHDPGLPLHLVMTPLEYLGDLALFVPVDPMALAPFWRAHLLPFAAFAVAVVATFAGTVRDASPRLRAWGLGWMIVTALPVAMLTVAEHFLYVPSIGYCVLVGARFAPDAPKPEAAAKAMGSVNGILIAVVVVALIRTSLFGAVAFTSRRAIDTAAEALDAAPHATTLAVADLPAAAVLAFPQALRLARPDHPVETAILSIDAGLLGHTDVSDVVGDDARGLHLERPADRGAGFLGSYLERALLGPATVHTGEAFARHGYDVSVREAPGGQLRSFDVRFDDPAHTVLLARRAGAWAALPPLNDRTSSSPSRP